MEMTMNPSTEPPAAVLHHCSPGPWQHGVRMPPFSTEEQLCVFGREHDLPIAMLDDTEPKVSANVVLMAAAWELYQQLHALLMSASSVSPASHPSESGMQVRNEFERTQLLLLRIQHEMELSLADKSEPQHRLLS
jgi:hypothetical protein